MTRTLFAFVLLSAGLASPSLAQTATPPTKTKPPAKAAAAPVKKAPAVPAAFTAAKDAGDKALKESRLDDALTEYYKALKIKPDWTEGWWHMGLISYDAQRYEPARDALRRVVTLSPNDARSWGIMGLCEFQLKDYDPALEHLQHARQLGVRSGDELSPVFRYHSAILLTRLGLFEQAQQVLNEFAVEGTDSPNVILAFGIATLRLPMLPTDLPGERRDAVMLAGRAQYFSASRLLPAATGAFEQLIARYPDLSNVHYAFGSFLLGEEPDRGVQELQKELQVTPNHSIAMLALAFEYIKRSDYPTAKTWAEKAVAADPMDFGARKALGQVLLETGDTDGAIRELEAGVKMAPTSPVMHFQLAKAYQKAGRTADAERERAEFTKLDRAVRAARAGQQSVGGVEDTGASTQPVPQSQD
jgi:tetratricopeptide (TPR) repeat protein